MLDDAYLVVEAFDEPEGDFVFRFAIGGDTVPVAFNHLRKLLIRLKALPAELGFPVVEELTGPGLGVVGSELIKCLPKDVGSVQPLVGFEQQFQALLTFAGKIFPVCKQDVFLTLDELALITRDARVFRFADLMRASPRWRRTWNLSNKMAACDAWAWVE